jgi:hypothetical protein
LRNTTKRERTAVSSPSSSRRLIEQQQQLQKNNDLLGKVADSTDRLSKTISLGEMLRVNYGAGVCLIYGSYTFVEAGTGRPLRVP